MSHGIKLLGLSVKDVGVLTGRVDVGPFAAARYFTPKTAVPTGVYRAAWDRQKEVETRVNKIEAAKAVVETLAAEYVVDLDRLRGAERSVPEAPAVP